MKREPTTTTGVPEWETLLPWLRAGTTRRARAAATTRSASEAATTRSASEAATTRSASEAATIRRAGEAAPTPLRTGWRSIVRSRQVHGAVTKLHTAPPAGESVVGEADGHLTRQPGVLLTVTLADCVPVFLADPAHHAVALLHSGWRGTAAGVLEHGLAAMARAFGTAPEDLFVHLGPAICGECYEVGPGVFEALGEAPPSQPAPIDLRGAIRRRALAARIRAGRLTVSDECTLCGDGRYFSHRRGDTGRHRAFIGICSPPKAICGGQARVQGGL